MYSELMTWLLLAACGAGFGAGAIWQTMRRRTAAPVRRRADCVASRARTPEAQALASAGAGLRIIRLVGKPRLRPLENTSAFRGRSSAK